MGLSIVEIAKLAKSSKSTVSRVLNNSPRVDPETRRLIEQVLSKENYCRNSLAYRLKRKRTDTIGVIISAINLQDTTFNGFYIELIKGIGTIANVQSGYDILLQIPEKSLDMANCYTRLFDEQKVDGIIAIFPDSDDKRLNALIQRKLPAVSIGSVKVNMDYVTVDNERNVMEIMEHLAGLGHKRIGMINGNLGENDYVLRFKGYKKALIKHKLPYDEKLVIHNNRDQETGYQSMKKLLEYNVTAVFSATDLFAAGAVKAVKEDGLRVPQDIAIAGFDGVITTMTSVKQPFFEMGREAANLLLKKIKGEVKKRKKILLPGSFIISESTVI